MTDQNPIPFPPTNKFHQWEDNILNERENVDVVLECVWKDGFQAGADQELEACCEWLQDPDLNVDTYKLRAARRPSAPTLKEQALKALRQVGNCEEIDNVTFETIRRAIEALPND